MLSTLPLLAVAAPDADLVKSLPGWDAPLPSAMYSGFLKLPGTQKQLHYLLVEAEPPLDKATAPLVLWLNGGPGCSSLEGFFYEHGPLVVGDAHAPPNINFANDPSANLNATGKLFRNPWAWSRAASILYLEAPAGVGFSFSPVASEERNGDNGTAADNLAALEQFFLKFPEFKSNPFYVSGESYGGVYVPTLSQKIYQAGAAFGGNMSGYLVGNGVFDHTEALPTHAAFAAGHGFLSTAFAAKVDAACGDYSKVTVKCTALLARVSAFEVDMNGYDAYRTCYQPGGARRRAPVTLSALVERIVVNDEPPRAAIAAWMRQVFRSQPLWTLAPAIPNVCLAVARSSSACRASTRCRGRPTSTSQTSRKRCTSTRRPTRGRSAAASTTRTTACTTR